MGASFAFDIVELSVRPDLPLFIEKVCNSKVGASYSGDQGQLRFLRELISDSSLRQSIHYRGALDVWDVFPEAKGDRLVVEVMTAHHSAYLRGDGTPNDSESPNPIYFLAVPAGSQFDFNVVCHLDRLPDPVRARWRALLNAAFDHAFSWLGFGAKTAVGYGEMRRKGAAPPSAAVGFVKSATIVAQGEVWVGALLTWNTSTQLITARSSDKAKLAHSRTNDAARAALEAELGDQLDRLELPALL